MFKRHSLLLMMVLGLLLVLGACAGAPQPETEQPAGGEQANQVKDTMIVAKQSDPSSLDPHLASDEAAIRCIENMYNTLLTYTDGYGEVAPSLAKSYEVSDDNLTYTLHLIQGVKFHSGRVMTADDVVYSIERIKNEGVRASHFEKVASVEAADDHTVVITLSEPFAPFATYLAHPCNVIVDQDAVEANGGKLTNADGGTGPFMLEKWDVGTQLSLTKFADYWEAGKPVMNHLVFRTIADSTARSTALRNGEVDMIIDVTEQEIAVLKNAEGVVVESVPGTFWEYLGMNCEHQYLDNVKVRQALANAIDRDAINAAVKMGNAEVLHVANLPSTHEAYADLNIYPARDLEKAKNLLAEAGYQAGEINLELLVGSDWQYQVDAAQMIKAQAAEAGITIAISALESGIFFDNLNNGAFDLTVVGWSGFVDMDEYFYNLFRSDGAYNQQNYTNPELDRLLDQGRTTLDHAARLDIYQQIQQIVAEDAPMAFLYMNNYTVAMRDNVQNYIVHPTAATIWLKDVSFK